VQPKIAKKSLKTLILALKVIKVINVDDSKKLVSSACYVKQHLCLSATIFTLDEPITVE